MRAMGLLAAAKVSESSSKKGTKEMVIGHPVELMGNSGRHEMGRHELGFGLSHELNGRSAAIELPVRAYR